jgi:hypothetical protein
MFIKVILSVRFIYLAALCFIATALISVQIFLLVDNLCN